MKNIVTILLCIISQTALSQVDYSNYYATLQKCEFSQDIKYIEKTYKKAFKQNKPLSSSLLKLSSDCYYCQKIKKAKKYLLKAASTGLDRETVSATSIMDSVLNIDKRLNKKFEHKYHIFLTKKCDLINSIYIQHLFYSDQSIRSHFQKYTLVDTLFSKYRSKEILRQDSVNYFALIKILRQPDFNPFILTEAAKQGIEFILTHSATNSYVNADSVFSLMKKMLLAGIISPAFYAFSYDRYYMQTFGQNYYCHFYNSKLPIYDINNVDKRRSELWIYPLYIKFKLNNELDKLPKDYKYDFDTIRR